jgi:hypothetical protein
MSMLSSVIGRSVQRSVIPQGDLDNITRLKFEFLVRDEVFHAVGTASDNRYRGLVTKSAPKLFAGALQLEPDCAERHGGVLQLPKQIAPALAAESLVLPQKIVPLPPLLLR